MRCARSTVLLAAPLAALLAHLLAPKLASAQSRPELPEGTRIRIVVLSADLLNAAPEDERATARVVRADADSIAYRLDRSYATRVVPWWQVKELDVSDGRRLRTAADTWARPRSSRSLERASPTPPGTRAMIRSRT